jgi:spore germination protein KC
MTKIAMRLACLLLATALLLTGCWDNQEPRRRAYVLGMGVDPDKNDPSGLVVTLQIPLPVSTKQMGGPGTARDYYLVKGTGRNVLEAFGDIQSRVSRELFFGQMRTVLFSSHLPATLLGQVMEAFERNPDIEETIYVLVARGRADTVLQSFTPQERLPALYFNHAMESVQRRATYEPVRIWEFWRTVQTPGWEPVVPVAQAAAKDEIRLEGLAVFHNYELRGFLEKNEAQGYLWLTGVARGAVETFPVDEGQAVIRSLQVRRNASVRFAGGRPVIQVSLYATGEVANPGGLTGEIAALEAGAERAILAQTRAVLTKAQEQYRSDIFGFGKLLYYRYPAYFSRVDWDEAWPTTPVEVKATVRLTRTGMVD